MLEASGKRVGLVLSDAAIDEGREARNAFSMLIVRGIWRAFLAWRIALGVVAWSYAYAIETYTLETDFAHELCSGNALALRPRLGRAVVQGNHGFGRVHGHCCGGGYAQP